MMDGDVEKNVKIFDNFPAYPCLELDMSMHRVEAGFMRHLQPLIDCITGFPDQVDAYL